MEDEIWKDIKGLESKYQVSNKGNVRSLDMITNNGKQLRKGRIRKLSMNKYGYKCVSVIVNGKLKSLSVHRLVALAFIENPYNFPLINHKDENRANNCVDNLEWCDFKYNSNYGNRNKKLSESIKKLNMNPINKIPVLQIDKCTKKILRAFNSIDEAVKILGFNTRSHISECCSKKTKRKTAYGYIWEYAPPNF